MGPAGANGGPRNARKRGARRHDWISVSLDRAYQQVAAEPIPDQWMNLLAQLDEDPPPKAGSDAGS